MYYVSRGICAGGRLDSFPARAYNGGKGYSCTLHEKRAPGSARMRGMTALELSIWIIADALRRFQPELTVTSGGMEICGVRPLLDEGRMRADVLYVAPGADGAGAECIHGAERIRIRSADADTVLDAVLDAFERFQRWSEALHAAVQRGDSIQDILDLSCGVLPFPIAVADPFGNIAGCSRGYEALAEEDPYWNCVLRERRLSDRVFSENARDENGAEIRDWDSTPRIYRTGPRRIIGVNLTAGDEIAGTMVIVEEGGELTEGTCQLTELLCAAIAGTLSAQGDSAETRAMMSMLESYLDGGSDDIGPIWAGICERTGCGDGGEMELLLLKNVYRGDTPFCSSLAYRIGRGVDGCFGLVFHNFTAVILSCEREAQALKALWKMLPQEEYLCGVSLPFSDAKGLQKAGNQAALALVCGGQTPPSLSRCVDHAFMYFLSNLARDKSFGTELLHPGLKRLKQYDASHGTDFYNTLCQYLLCERNVVAAARALFIHRNSMIYRLQRIQQLLDVDLDDVNVRMYLLLSYQIEWSAKNFPGGDPFPGEGFPGAEEGRRHFWEEVRRRL